MFSRPILLSGYFHTSSLLVVTLLLGSTSLEISSTRTDRIFTLDDTNLPVVQSQTIDEQFGKIISSSSSSSSSSLSRDAGEGRLLWSLNDNNAITENIALSADGRWVAVGFTLNDERLEVRDAASGQLQFAYSVETGGSNVAISSDGSLIAFSAMDSLWLFRRQNGAQPVMRVGFNGFTTMQVAISGDGRWIYAAGLDPQRRRNRLWAFRDGNPQAVWTAEVDAAEAYGWSGVTLTRDGQLLAANGKFHLYIYNAQNGDLIWDEPTYNTESPTALSSDGRILATASLSGRLRVFARDPQAGYRLLWHYNFTSGISTWVSACAVSADGNTIAAGTLDFYEDHYAGRVTVFEAFGRGQPLWISDDLSDEVSKIEMTSDGGVIAAASWGDIDHRNPDFVVFERHSRSPFYNLTTPGSLDGLSMTQDGRRVVIGGKGVHNRQFGRGGQVHSIDLNLLGGRVSGIVRDMNNNPIPDAQITAGQNPYAVISDNNGCYSLLIETSNQRNVDLTVRCRGYANAVRRDVAVVRDRITENIDFRLALADAPPQNLRASQGARNVIHLQWDAYNFFNDDDDNNDDDIYAAIDNRKLPKPEVDLWGKPAVPRRDDQDEADSIRIYRAYLPGGPYAHISSAAGDQSRWSDRMSIFPQRRYYYCITALFADGESRYSNEAAGWLDDAFLQTDARLESMPRAPRIDGRISDNEWQGAVVRDISDVFGYDQPDSAGSVQALIGFSDVTKRLYLGVRYYTLGTIIERSGVGIYIDDDGSGSWTANRPGCEGNYWGYWRDGSPDLRFRSLTGAPFNAEPYYQFPDSLLAFRDDEGYVVIETSLPLGFQNPFEIALYAPDYTIGLGLFAMWRDVFNVPAFHGWWPQDMFSIVTEPQQYARIAIPAHLAVPPQAPSDIFVGPDGDVIAVSWRDPMRGIDNGALGEWQGVRIYRNGAALGQVRPGQETYIDENVEDRGWYEYSLAGYILDNGVPFEGPRSRPQGAYAGREPEVIEYAYDDGAAEFLYVVAFNGVDNRFAVCFDIEADSPDMALWWVDFYSGGLQPIDIYIAADENGRPGRMIGRRLRAEPQVIDAFERYRFPGLEQPGFQVEPGEWRQIWVVLNYLPDSPGGPAVGVDNSAPDNRRNMYYTAANGWQGFNFGQLMLRAAAGTAARDIPPGETNPLPTEFKVWANYPNPFNSATILPVDLPQPSPLKVFVYDHRGRLVYSRVEPELSAGRKKLTLAIDNVNTGSYIISVNSIFGRQQVKSVLVK